MQDCWVMDDKAPGPLAAEIETSFEMWCEEHRRADLLASYPRSNELIKAIKGIEAYSWLRKVKPHGQTRRYPGIRRRTKDDRQKEEKAELEAELKAQEAKVPVKAPVGYRRF